MSLLRSFAFFFLVVIFPAAAFLQEEAYPFEKWNKKGQLQAANNCEGVTYMNEVEKQILYFCNLVRINPKLFGETYLQVFIDSADYDRSDSYVSSLFAQVAQRKKGQPLKPDENLYNMAKDHAVTTGEKGTTGHAGYNARMKIFLGDDYLPTGENCSYGYNTALEIFLQLLVDEDVPSLGHRENILSRDFNAVGISIQPHETYEWTCVMEFGYTEPY